MDALTQDEKSVNTDKRSGASKRDSSGAGGVGFNIDGYVYYNAFHQETALTPVAVKHEQC